MKARAGRPAGLFLVERHRGQGRTQAQWVALKALLASMVMIVIYVWIRFQSIMFGLAAVLALIHDVLVTVGFLALSYWLAPYFGWAWSINSRSAWPWWRRY